MTEITGGVDTHRDNHVAAALDQLGRLLGTQSFPATRTGYRHLLAWLTGFGQLVAVGVEGTGSYGAGLARHLRAEGVTVIEVDRPDRRIRRRQGKSDPVDAVAAARAVQAGTASGIPKTRDGVVESIRSLRVVREGAIKAHTAALNSLRQLVISAPDALREQLQNLPVGKLLDRCSRMRPAADLRSPDAAVKQALQRLARRCQHLAEEIADADRDLKTLLEQTAPRLLERTGVGTAVAAQLLTTAGDKPPPAALRRFLRRALRRQPTSCLIRPHRPPPAQPRRRQSRQLRPLLDRARPHALRPGHQGLRRSTHRAGTDQARDHALPQTLRRPRTAAADPRCPRAQDHTRTR